MVEIFLSFGATEAKPPEDVDAIFDITETGTTLIQNNLKIIDQVMESTAVLIANKDVSKGSYKKGKNIRHDCPIKRSSRSKKKITYIC